MRMGHIFSAIVKASTLVYYNTAVDDICAL